MQDYSKEDVIKVFLRPDSISNWDISSPSRDALIMDLYNSTKPLTLETFMEFERPRMSEKKEPVVHSYSRKIKLHPHEKLREELFKLVKPKTGVKSVDILRLFPPYLIVPQLGKLQLATELLIGTVKSCPTLLTLV